MTSLALTGGLNHTKRFEQDLTVEAVRALPCTQQFSVDDVIEHLDRAGIEHDELRQAWEGVPVDDGRGHNVITHQLRRRPLAVDGSGYLAAARHLNPVLAEYAQVRVDHWAGRTDAAIPIGWQPRQLGLAPTAAQNTEVLGRLNDAPGRAELWSASDSGNPNGLHLLEFAHDALGRGLVTADSTITEELAGQAVYRLWWRDDGDLDVVGVLRALLVGAVPIQVMPDSVAQRCRLHLTAPWHHLVHDRSRLPVLTRDYATELTGELVAWLSEHDQESLVKAWQERTGTDG